jgi:phosphatidylinositol dimannoside acyltransferase
VPDLITPAYRTAAWVAQHLPGPVVEKGAAELAGLWGMRPSEKRRQVERHQRRVEPSLHGRELQRRVRDVYRAYGRYYGESFRLPTVSTEELERRFTSEGLEHFEAALEGDVGPIAVLPHLGSWEWTAQWVARVMHVPVTAVVEPLEPPALFDWFRSFREKIGMHVVALGPDAGKAVTRALKQRHVVALLSDRDIAGGGIQVEFFGERTTLPAGPATLALRVGAPLLPLGMYDQPHGGHHAVVKPPLPVERLGSFRSDVTRLTQDIATALEDLIRHAPEQWHLLQPNWPSDRTPVRL